MTEPAETANHSHAVISADVAKELLGIVQAVAGVVSVYPAQPLWQSIAGAAVAAITGEALPLIGVTVSPDGVAVKARIGVGTVRPAPEVAREAAAAVRQHLHPASAAVEILVVKIGP
ncbi:hypothetical protein [Arthrobacter sp. Rue61a]|jgi:hypothetical protein|uniref:Asp23/Gls24 family envelope stress response protein n=1 Tax=Paenarthrobacter aurescens (strain TC1) TaxID=290340 RepID=A1RBK2_PAEAT|nr:MULTISPECIES: hypothetical protein [Micrococcaceae]ABM10227.1 hypothetical protein AAur_3939 [Paenarthrobacter aurescens TC1]AFR30952.1 hypothetical protein ARUE_c40800 [Arthrobacter sp. Rue61a]